jgi:tetratricopeptide (TPR) repeat protein/predicted Ser/Thr protein kinase
MSRDPLDRVKDFFGEEDPPPARWGRYEIVREIARGGMSIVYEARDPDAGRSVALKVLKGGPLERLRREAQAAARLRHPNVVALHEVGPDYLTMDLLRGRTLAAALPELSRDARLGVLETVARAVAHAHAQGVVHRDLKPENVMIEPDGRVVLTDFGLARIEGGEDLTRTGTVFGTPHYMAPEQVQGSDCGPAADVWALGVLLYEVLEGRRPFEAATALAVYDRIVREDAPPLPGDLGAILAKALAKAPRERYPDAGAFAEDLARARKGEPVSVRPLGPAGRLFRRVRRNPLPAVVGAVLVLAAGLAAARQVERGRAVRSMREKARVSLEAALDLRRAGALAQMRKFREPLEEVRREAGDLPEANYLLGRLLRATLDLEAARRCQEAALLEDPFYAPSRYERAVLTALHGGRPALDEPVRSPVEWRDAVRADAQLYLGTPKPAVVGQGPEAPAVARGLVCFADGRLADARRAFEEALGLDPLCEEARELLAAVIRGEILPSFEESERRSRQAEQLLAEGLEKDRGYLPHYYARGELRWNRGSRHRHRGLDPMPDYTAAEGDFTEALRLDPDSYRALHWRGQVRVYQGIWFMETDQDPTAAWNSAQADLDRAIRLNPGHSSGWLWRGILNFYRGFWKAAHGRDALADFAAADRDLERAVEVAVEPTNERRWHGRLLAQYAAALARSGQDARPIFVRAEEEFRRAEARNDRDPWFWTWRSTVGSERAAAEAARGEAFEPDFARAETQLGRAIAADRTMMEAWKHRGFLRWTRAGLRLGAGNRDGAREDYAGAASDFLEALSINPTLKFQIGDRGDAARRKAAELSPSK